MVTIRNYHNVKNTAVSLVFILVQSAHLHLPPLIFYYYCHIIKKLRNWDQRNVKKSIHQNIKCNCITKKYTQRWWFRIFLFQHFFILIVRKLFLMPELNLPYCNRNCLAFILPTGDVLKCLFPSPLFSYLEPIITSFLCFLYINHFVFSISPQVAFHSSGLFLAVQITRQCPRWKCSTCRGFTRAQQSTGIHTFLLVWEGVCLFCRNMMLLAHVQPVVINYKPFAAALLFKLTMLVQQITPN